jgi:hypothetical protein
VADLELDSKKCDFDGIKLGFLYEICDHHSVCNFDRGAFGLQYIRVVNFVLTFRLSASF